MKFGKEEIQKIFLGLLVLGGVLYYYFEMLLGPLEKETKDAQQTVLQLKPKIKEADSFIKNAQGLEKDGTAAVETVEEIKALIPDGAPLAWLQPKMTAFFQQQGITKCTVRMGGASDNKALTGFQDLSWTFDAPHVELVQMGIAIAALENEHPLDEIQSLDIQELRDDVQYQSARMSLSTIIKHNE